MPTDYIQFTTKQKKLLADSIDDGSALTATGFMGVVFFPAISRHLR